jgi:hypothetical protein
MSLAELSPGICGLVLRFKPRVVARNEYVMRDVVPFWGYDRFS